MEKAYLMKTDWRKQMKKKKLKEKIQIQNTETEKTEATVVKIMNKQAQVLAGDRLVTCLLPQALVSRKNALVVKSEAKRS